MLSEACVLEKEGDSLISVLVKWQWVIAFACGHKSNMETWERVQMRASVTVKGLESLNPNIIITTIC